MAYNLESVITGRSLLKLKLQTFLAFQLHTVPFLSIIQGRYNSHYCQFSSSFDPAYFPSNITVLIGIHDTNERHPLSSVLFNLENGTESLGPQ